MSAIVCDICGAEIVSRCRCPRGDTTCKNGHRYHYGPNGEIHLGHSNHGSPICCLLGKKSEQPKDDFQERIEHAKKELGNLIEAYKKHGGAPLEISRLEGKLEGVALAEGYYIEMKREKKIM